MNRARRIAAALVLILSCPIARSAPPPAPRPNILLILSDDMGYSDLGCYGSEIATPNLDKLAAGGVRFTQFYNTARCCSTRASLLTGLYSHQAGIGHMVEDKGLDGYRGQLNDKCVTIAQVMKSAGYATYITGKWHVTRELKGDGPKTAWPLQRGFDRYYGTILGGGNYWDPAGLTRDNTFITHITDKEYQPKAGEPFYYTDAIADNAIRFISEHHQKMPEKPFFFYCAFTAAHWPMHARPEDIAKYKGKYDAGYEPVRLARLEKMRKLGLIKPEWKLTEQAGDWDKVADKAWEARCMEVYAAMVDRLDQSIGRIVENLRQTGQLDNTLILFLQDNGACAEPTGRNRGAEEVKDRPAKPTMAPLPDGEVMMGSSPTRTRDGYPIRHGVGVMPGPEDTHIAYGKSWANVSNTPFREYKHWEHEGGVSTPLIAYWPKGIERHGDLENQPGHLVDIMVTAAELGGATYPKQFNGHDITPAEGTSLVPALAGKPIERAGIYWEHEGNRAVRVGNWKLVAKGPGGKWELYDMNADRTETNDLASAHPDKVKELKEKWETWAKRTGAIPWPWKPAYGASDAGADAGGAGTGAAAGGAAGGAGGTKPGKRAAGKGAGGFSKERVFTLKAGDLLDGEAAPDTGGKSLRITAKIAESGEGVILAQGGTASGFTLYIHDGLPTLAVRIGNKLHAVAAMEKLPSGPIELSASLAKDGAATIAVNGKESARGKFPGPLNRTPTDSLSAGQDSNAAVGEYTAPNAFKGKLGEIKLELE